MGGGRLPSISSVHPQAAKGGLFRGVPSVGNVCLDLLYVLSLIVPIDLLDPMDVIVSVDFVSQTFVMCRTM